jgi:hypothetical protein
MLGWNEAEKHDIEIKKPMTNEEAREIIDKLGLR